MKKILASESEQGLKGRKEGKQEERINMARNLMDILDDYIIAEKTGLTLAEVQEIRSKRP